MPISTNRIDELPIFVYPTNPDTRLLIGDEISWYSRRYRQMITGRIVKASLRLRWRGAVSVAIVALPHRTPELKKRHYPVYPVRVSNIEFISRFHETEKLSIKDIARLASAIRD